MLMMIEKGVYVYVHILAIQNNKEKIRSQIWEKNFSAFLVKSAVQWLDIFSTISFI